MMILKLDLNVIHSTGQILTLIHVCIVMTRRLFVPNRPRFSLTVYIEQGCACASLLDISGSFTLIEIYESVCILYKIGLIEIV